MGEAKPHPPGCVCWQDPDWNCMVDICDAYRTESRDKLCDNCDHKAECHSAERAALAAQLAEAVGLLRRLRVDAGEDAHGWLIGTSAEQLAQLDAFLMRVGVKSNLTRDAKDW